MLSYPSWERWAGACTVSAHAYQWGSVRVPKPGAGGRAPILSRELPGQGWWWGLERLLIHPGRAEEDFLEEVTVCAGFQQKSSRSSPTHGEKDGGNKERLPGDGARPKEWCQAGLGRGKVRGVSRGQITLVTLGD